MQNDKEQWQSDKLQSGRKKLVCFLRPVNHDDYIRTKSWPKRINIPSADPTERSLQTLIDGSQSVTTHPLNADIRLNT